MQRKLHLPECVAQGGAGHATGGKGGIRARPRAVVGCGGRGSAGAGQAAEAAEAAAAGWVGMEPGEGPGALDLHGDEEIIEVVELGPPGPGETGRPAPRTGQGLRGSGHPPGHRERCGPTPVPGPAGASPRPAASPRVASRSSAISLLWDSRPRRHRASPAAPSRSHPRCTAEHAASRALTFALCR